MAVLFSLFGRRCEYGGEDEYYIKVRESGNHQQALSNIEEQTQRSQDRTILSHMFARNHDRQAACTLMLRFANTTCQDDGPALGDVQLDMVSAHEARMTAAASAQCALTSEVGIFFSIDIAFLHPLVATVYFLLLVITRYQSSITPH